MIHILDHQTDEILDFVTLDNIIEDNHKKSLEDTLETYDFIAFGDKRYSEFLDKRNRVIIPDEDGTLREFVIFESARYLDTEGRKIQTFAHASYLELKKASVVYPSKFKGTASQHGGRALNGTGWSIGLVEVDGDITININEHTVPYEYLKRIAKEFDGELSFRIEHDGRRVTGRYVDILERVGTWQGREVEFGKDLDSIRRVEKQDIVTALLGLGPERDDGTRIEVLVEDNDALQRWGRVDEYGELQHLIEPYEIQSERSEMTMTEAIRYTRTALNKRIDTQITYETTILDLEEVAGHENKKIRFGDTIKIKDEKFNPPLYLEARVFEMTRSIKRKDKKDIKLGDFIEHTEEDVNAIWNQLKQDIQNRVSFYEMAEYTYNKLTIDEKDEIVFEEGKTFAEATGITAEENAKEYANGLKVNIDKEIKGVSNSVGSLNNYIDGAFKDGVISESEAKAIEKYINTLNAEKANVDNRYTNVFQNPHLKGTTKTNLLNAKTNFNGAHNELIIAINTAISDGKTTPIEKKNVDNKFTAYKDTLANLSKRFEQAVDLIAKNKADEAEQKAKDYAVQQDQIVKEYADKVSEQEAQSALEQAKMYAVAETVYNQQMEKIASDISERAPIEYVDGQLRHAIDNLEIGGRNFLLETTSEETEFSFDSWNDSNIFYVSESGVREIAKGGTFTASVDITEFKTGSNRLGLIVFLYKGNSMVSQHFGYSHFIQPLETGKVTFTFELNENDIDRVFVNLRHDSSSAPTSTGKFANIKLEKGNKATDWSPAPEDMFSEIEKKADGSTVYTIEQIDNKINNLVSVTQYTADMGGIITNINTHGTRIGQNEKAIGLKADSSQLDAVENSLNTKIGNVEVTAEGAKMSASEVRADLDGLEIGGRNLIKDSNVFNNLIAYEGASINYQKNVIVEEWGASDATRVTTSGGTSVLKAFKQLPTGTVIEGETYTASIYVSNLRGTPIIVQINGFEGRPEVRVNPEESRRVVITGVATGSTITQFQYRTSNVIHGTNFVVWRAQLEKGNKATDWSPAPEDTDEAINQVSGRVETLDGEVTALAGEVRLKASQSVVDSLEGRVSTAEGELRVLPGEIDAKVSRDGIVGAINATPEQLLIDFDKVNITGQLEAKHIKSLAGLNVNDQFVVDRNGKVTIGNDRVMIDDKSISITRPDGAIWMQDGMVQQDYAVGGFDPPLIDLGKTTSSTGSWEWDALSPWRGFYRTVELGDLDGGNSGGGNTYEDVRDSSKNYTMNFQRYEFIHASRYIVFGLRIANNATQPSQARFCVYDGSTQLARVDVDRYAGYHPIVVDLGRPTFERLSLDFRYGWVKGDRNVKDLLSFRVNRVYLTDYI